MLRQKREKNGTGICHVMQGKESKTCPCDFFGMLQIIVENLVIALVIAVIAKTGKIFLACIM